MVARQGRQGGPGHPEQAQAVSQPMSRRQGWRQAGNMAQWVSVRARAGGVSGVKQLHDLGAGRW